MHIIPSPQCIIQKKGQICLAACGLNIGEAGRVGMCWVWPTGKQSEGREEESESLKDMATL